MEKENTKFVKRYHINTTMETADNRNYLYIRTFKQNSAIFIPMLVLALIGTVLLGFAFKTMNPIRLLEFFGFSLLLVLAVLLLKIEIGHKKIIKEFAPKGLYGNRTQMAFYDDYMIMESSMASDKKSVLYYKDFYGLVETGGYYIFYYTRANATLLRKRDMDKDKNFREEFGRFIQDRFQGKYRKL